MYSRSAVVVVEGQTLMKLLWWLSTTVKLAAVACLILAGYYESMILAVAGGFFSGVALELYRYLGRVQQWCIENEE